MNRKSWDLYFLDMLDMVASRSTCVKAQVGAIFADNRHRILATGYNGPPRGISHECLEKGECRRTRLGFKAGEGYEHCPAAHAEQNGICQAASTGISLEGSTLYIPYWPCMTCTRLIINVGVKTIVMKDDGYLRNKLTYEMTKEAQIECFIIENKNRKKITYEQPLVAPHSRHL